LYYHIKQDQEDSKYACTSEQYGIDKESADAIEKVTDSYTSANSTPVSIRVLRDSTILSLTEFIASSSSCKSDVATISSILNEFYNSVLSCVKEILESNSNEETMTILGNIRPLVLPISNYDQLIRRLCDDQRFIAPVPVSFGSALRFVDGIAQRKDMVAQYVPIKLLSFCSLILKCGGP
jgi:hypothetical protein